MACSACNKRKAAAKAQAGLNRAKSNSPRIKRQNPVSRIRSVKRPR